MSETKARARRAGASKLHEVPGERLELVPRFAAQGYEEADVAARRAWLEEKLGCSLPMIGAGAIAGPTMRGNVENPIGAAQVPLGIAGPLLVHGEHARDIFYVPFATTEGALVRSYERGMLALTRGGGVTARVLQDENSATPLFAFSELEQAVELARALPALFPQLAEAAAATTAHGRLVRVEPRVIGREVLVTCVFSTGDASGMNMVGRATHAVCELLVERFRPRRWLLMSGAEAEKRAAGALLAGGKGKSVVATARLAPAIVRSVLGVEAALMVECWRASTRAQAEAASLGINVQAANALAAVFIALGQDVANVVNAATAVFALDASADGGLELQVHLPSLTVATVGGGTGIGTAPECLDILGCRGDGHARKLAEILAATVLAGELSLSAAVAAGQHAEAHDRYGRKR